MAQEQVPALAASDAWEDGVATVTVRGDIDTTTAGVLAGCLAKLVASRPERLIIGLAAAGFLDSTAVHAFIGARHALPGDCPLVLRSPQRQARRVFELTGLNAVCVIE